jgi:transposase
MQLQLRTILNHVHKLKSFVYDDVRLVDHKGGARIEARVEPRRNARSICPHCDRPCPRYDRQPERTFEFIPLWNILVLLLYKPWRVSCPDHGVVVEAMPWAHGKSPMTNALMCFLASWAKRLSWWETARCFLSSWDKVRASVEWVVEWGLEHRNLDGINAIGIDEVAWRKGHKYLTLVYDISAGSRRLLWIGQDRSRATINNFFEWFGEQRCKALLFVCSDMWKPYMGAVGKYASKALNILDRFHIAKHLNDAVDQTRRQEAADFRRKGDKVILKHARWCLLKRVKNLTYNQSARLHDLLKLNLKVVRAYLMKEDFDSFWAYSRPAWAGRFLDAWCTRAMRSRIEPMKKVAKMLRNHRGLILNYFRAKKQFNSGVIEGLNNKLKLVTRKSYGFRTVETLKIALYHTLGNLPMPPTTHRFV